MKRLMSLGMTAALVALLGCGNGTGPQGTVSLTFSGSQPGQSVSLSHVASLGISADPLVGPDGNELIITSAQVVLREIEMKRVETTDCDLVPEGSDDECEEFETGPVLIDVPVDGNTFTPVSVNAPAGDYDEIEFEIHKISSSDQEDADFRAAHPDFAGISIKVVGTWNGNNFTYTSDLDVEQEFDISPPMPVLDDGSSTNLTVRLDLAKWFVDASGNYVDPATANKGGQNEGLVKENIKQSVEAFEDKDRDGDHSDES